ncbi:hypothetical protein OB955_20825 [Halobacteria archaeon AArc-m2/3/4]|uniref:Uncharacterized protein n=1 Tax=Natronoglomus mannanivorans TaxID=2979990 RepID=A0AAP2YYK6_9EURY|nr:hypothetical protein [Halobacteria archaeon AArc-xg1-1]MCU4975148.1 hypothetical protein [Halobacteria archaeon AArc-m2/3/4]
MLEQLSCTCDRCETPLGDEQLILSMTTDAGTRRAYECSCRAVTITVVGDEAVQRAERADERRP